MIDQCCVLLPTRPTANSEGDDDVEYAREQEDGLQCDEVEATHSDTTLVLHTLESASIRVDHVVDDDVGGDNDIEVGHWMLGWIFKVVNLC